MEAKEQVAAAMQKLEELTEPENYKKLATGGGDNIRLKVLKCLKKCLKKRILIEEFFFCVSERREVGTVGVTSPLFQVDKAENVGAE